MSIFKKKQKTKGLTCNQLVKNIDAMFCKQEKESKQKEQSQKQKVVKITSAEQIIN